MATKQEILDQFGEFLDWAWNGPLDEWLADSCLYDGTDEPWVEQIIHHIQQLQVSDIR